MKRKIVISGINIFEGGALSIFYDCLDSIVSLHLDSEFEFTVFVNSVSLFNRYIGHFSFIELPKSRKHYWNRVWYEYFYFHRYSSKKHIYLWFSIHDITPNVVSEKRFVYCHNPSPFYKSTIKDLFIDPKLFLFSRLYMFLYKINIQKNDAVIVQEQWMKKEFLKRTKAKHVIVSKPSISFTFSSYLKQDTTSKRFSFFYPAFPRSFKNFEVICQAAAILNDSLPFDIFLTIDGTENKYSKNIVKRYSKIENIHFLGRLSRNGVFDMYKFSDCLLFPSRLETWGLPITEFKETKKPIVLSDLPYAHETLGNYEKACFFDQDSSTSLANIMRKLITRDYSVLSKAFSPNFSDFNDWPSLLKWMVLEK